MSTEQNKALARRFVAEVVNGGNLALIDDLVAPNFSSHPALPGVGDPRAVLKQFVTRFTTSFASMLRIRDGMVAERWNVSDTLGLVQQLGATLTVPTAAEG